MFSFIPKFSYVLKLVCFDVVVQTQHLTGYMEMTISICEV